MNKAKLNKAIKETKAFKEDLDIQASIKTIRQRFIDVLEVRLNKLKLDRKNYSNSFKGRISPTYSPTALIYYRSLDVRINELELTISDVKNVYKLDSDV